MIDIRDLIVNQGFAKAILGAGGGSGESPSVKIAGGVFTANGSPITIQHGLGVVPDFVVVWCPNTIGTPTSTFMQFYAGFSNAFRKSIMAAYQTDGYKHSISALYSNKFASGNVNGNTLSGSESTDIDKQSNKTINSANENSFVIGSSSLSPYNGELYCWFAIGGLT